MLYSHKQWVIIATLVLFALSRVVDLHVHGHFGPEHAHAVVEVEHEHTDSVGKTHLVSAIDHDGDHGIVDSHHDEITFDIEPDFSAKKPNPSFSSKLILFFTSLLIAWMVLWQSPFLRNRFDDGIPLPTSYYVKNPPLRGPPHH